MADIDLNAFAAAIHRQYPGRTMAVCERYAKMWREEIDDSLQSALNCWISGKPVPNIKVGKYSIWDIMSIRPEDDWLQAILLMSEYIKNPVRGEARILQPVR